MNTSDRYVVITTDANRRGVFGGVLESQSGDVVVLRNARMCIFWSAETHGVLGLAATGPKPGSRLSPAIPRIEVNGVTAIMDVTPEARKTWENWKWDQPSE